MPFGGLFGDCGDYRGWVLASSGDGQGALLSYQVKSSREGGIWAPGGAVTDPSGNLYVAVGNAEGQGFNYGNSVIRLTPDLQEAAYCAPSNWAALNASDTDVGSITPALLEDGLLFQAGKAGTGYLVRSDRLGGVGGEVFSAPVCNGLDYGAVAYAPPFLYVPCRNVGVTRCGSVPTGSTSPGRSPAAVTPRSLPVARSGPSGAAPCSRSRSTLVRSGPESLSRARRASPPSPPATAGSTSPPGASYWPWGRLSRREALPTARCRG